MTELPQITKSSYKEKPYRLVIHGWSMDLSAPELLAIERQISDIMKCEKCLGSGVVPEDGPQGLSGCPQCNGYGH